MLNKNFRTYGKICIPKHIFYKLGGYDESLLPTAYQDGDIMERARAMNFEIISKPILVDAIPNTMEEKVNQTGLKDWGECWHANKAKSDFNISKNNLIANKFENSQKIQDFSLINTKYDKLFAQIGKSI